MKIENMYEDGEWYSLTTEEATTFSMGHTLPHNFHE